MTDADGNLMERADYSPYGVARQRPPADLNGDGEIDGVDQLILFNAWGAPFGSAAYNPDADINSNCVVDGTDLVILSNEFGAAPAPAGAISKHGNTVGYSGYIHDEAISLSSLSLARFRWFDAETGRWATRDPIGYADTMNLYLYSSASPLSGTDPHGLFIVKLICNLLEEGHRRRCVDELTKGPSGNRHIHSRCEATFKSMAEKACNAKSSQEQDRRKNEALRYLSSCNAKMARHEAGSPYAGGLASIAREAAKGGCDGAVSALDGALLDVIPDTLRFDPGDPNLTYSKGLGAVAAVGLTGAAGTAAHAARGGAQFAVARTSISGRSHIVYGARAGSGSSYQWQSAIGPAIRTHSNFSPGRYTSVSNIPIKNADAALNATAGRNCATSAASALARGIAGTK